MKPTEMSEADLEKVFGCVIAALLIAVPASFGLFGFGLLFLTFGKAVGLSIFGGSLTFAIMCRVFGRKIFKK